MLFYIQHFLGYLGSLEMTYLQAHPKSKNRARQNNYTTSAICKKYHTVIGFQICHNFESRLVSSKLLRSYSSKFVSGDWEQYRTVYCESIEAAEEKLDI